MIDLFIEELKSIKDKFDWVIISGGSNESLIRGRLKKEVCDKGCCTNSFCPITAVHRIKTGQSYHSHSACDCDVGLHPLDRANIIKAADNHSNNEIRYKLLKALSLEENQWIVNIS